MGFNEFGQSLAGIIVFVTAMLLVFGGFQNQELFNDYLPNGITGPNDINTTASGITVSTTGTPFATTTSSTPTQDNNPWYNLIFDDFGKAFNLFTKMINGFVDVVSYIGLPGEIVYAIIVPLSVFAGIFLIYFVTGVAVGLFRGG